MFPAVFYCSRHFGKNIEKGKLVLRLHFRAKAMRSMSNNLALMMLLLLMRTGARAMDGARHVSQVDFFKLQVIRSLLCCHGNGII